MFCTEPKLSPEMFELGRERMSAASVAVCFIVRDAEERLPANIERLKQLRCLFARSRVFVFENDSRDGTREILRSWAETNTTVDVSFDDFGGKTIPDEDEGSVKSWFSRHRIGRMASYRNRYLEALEQCGEVFDYVLMVDMDLHGFSLAGIVSCFAGDTDWDAMTANGVFFRGDERVFFDTYAFLGEEEGLPFTRQMIEGNQQQMAGVTPGQSLIKVQSNFNGLGVYRFEAIEGLRYRCVDNDDSYVGVLCEHVSFHADMIANGFDRIYLNPDMLTVYNQMSAAKKKRGLWQRLKAKFG